MGIKNGHFHLLQINIFMMFSKHLVLESEVFLNDVLTLIFPRCSTRHFSVCRHLRAAF